MTTQMDNPFSVEKTKAVGFLSGKREKAYSAKFPKVGFEIDGTVLSWRMAQQTDNDTRELLFWENRRPTPQSQVAFPAQARPVDMMAIELQCDPTGVTWEGKDYEEVAIEDDDGKRVLYVAGGKVPALFQALQAASLQLPEDQGGRIQMRRERSVKANGAKYASHAFTARYTPAAQNPRAAKDLPAGPAGGGSAQSPFGDASQAVADPFGGQPAQVPDPFGG